MSPAALMSACAAACGVAAAWEFVLLVERSAPRRLLAPLLAAGREGPSAVEGQCTGKAPRAGKVRPGKKGAARHINPGSPTGSGKRRGAR